MSNYSELSNSCRVDFFKESGKWYTTEAIIFPEHTWDMSPSDALKTALREQLGTRLADMRAVCLEPYVKYSFPVCIDKWD